MALVINQQLNDSSGGTVAAGTIVYFGSYFKPSGIEVTVSIIAYKTNQIFLSGGNSYSFTELKNFQYAFEKTLDAAFWLNPLTNLHVMVKDWIVAKSAENGTPIAASNITIVLPSN